MDGPRFPSAQTWNAGQIEQLRKFLQIASQIPSTNSSQEVIQPKAAQPSFHGHRQNTAGASVAQPSHVASTAGSSRVSSSLILPVPDGVTAVKYPTPNVDSMVFDLGTGYRFDQSTGLFYDANAGLFVNKHLNVLLQWNPAISTYTLVGSASDVAAPALAQDLARLVGHGKIEAALPTVTTVSVPKLSVPSSSSSLDPVRDERFRRERSLDFEEMSPEREEEVSQQRGSDGGGEHSPGLGKYNVAERRRSLSFDEMTPERDLDDLPSVSVFPRDARSPCYARSPQRDASRSPRRRNSDRYSKDMRRSPDGRRTPVRGRKSPMRVYSRSPSPALSRWRHSPVDRYRRTFSPEKSPRRGSRLSPSSLHAQIRRISPERRRYSPERVSNKRSSSNRESRIGYDARLGDSGGRRYRRSLSPADQTRRKQNNYSERGQTSRYSRRSRSPSTVSRNKHRRSTSRPKTNYLSRSNSHSPSKSKSRLGGKEPRDEPAAQPVHTKSRLVDESYDSDPSGSRPNDEPTMCGEAVATAAVPSILVSSVSFSKSFMADNISRIHKTNLRNPRNTYGRLLPPQQLHSNFIMLTPLPHKGDREWEDLEILFERMLEDENVRFVSLKIFTGDGGAPCNYCLIRFKNPEEAFRWYVIHGGTIDLSGPDGSTCTVFMNFIQNNWKCKICKTLNFSLRHFCYKCFWFITQTKKPPLQVSPLVTDYVGIAGLDCRFLSIEDVLVGLPPVDSFNIESFELLVEPTGIPVGLCVFKFKDHQESAAFYRFLQESCLNPIFVNIIDRRGLDVNNVPGHLLKDIAKKNPVVAAKNEDTAVPEKETIVFPNPPETDCDNNPQLWWRFAEGYVPEEGGDIMKYLFEEHPAVNITFQSAPPQVLIGPLPIPLACDIMEYRDLLSRLLQNTGVCSKNSEKASICRAHHFGAPYNFSFLRFDCKTHSKEWLEKNKGKLVMHLENGSTWTAHLHYSKPNWQCPNCNKLNFPIRIQCFSCYKPRLSDHTPVSFKKNPTNFIGITGYQNWCSTEELLFKKLRFLRDMQNLTVSYLKEPTGVPLGICVLKSPNAAASEILFNKLQDALTNEIARASVQDPNRPLIVYIV